MTREELIAELNDLAKRSLASGHDAEAGVMYSLLGSIHMGTSRDLLNVCCDVAKRDLAVAETMTGKVHWPREI